VYQIGWIRDFRLIFGASTAASAAVRPLLSDETGVSWPLVDTAWVNFNAHERSLPGVIRDASEGERAHQTALIRYYENHDLPGARKAWTQQSEAPRDPNELLMLADVEADRGSDVAPSLIADLRRFQPTEADVLFAKLRLRQSRVEEAVIALESAAAAFRTDPWVGVQMQQALELIGTVAAKYPGVCTRLATAILELTRHGRVSSCSCAPIVIGRLTMRGWQRRTAT
jgi:hypothetical protein